MNLNLRLQCSAYCAGRPAMGSLCVVGTCAAGAFFVRAKSTVRCKRVIWSSCEVATVVGVPRQKNFMLAILN